MLLAPEIDATEESWPGPGARLPAMALNETSVRLPHDLVQFPELGEETGELVVNLLNVGAEQGMIVLLNVPQAVVQDTLLSASNFLLIETPLGKLDLMREQTAASHDMDQFELGLDGTKTLLCNVAVSPRLDDLHTEKIIGVTLEPFVTVGRNLVLPVCLRNGRTMVVVGVESPVGRGVIQSDDSTVLDVSEITSVPSSGPGDGVAFSVKGLCLVLDDPDVVLVLVRVQGDLLLLTAFGVHVIVRMKVTTLSVDVANSDSRSKNNISGSIHHTLVVEGSLELRGHEAIAFAGIGEAEEVDGEHAHIDRHGDNNKAKSTSEEVLEPKLCRSGFCVT